MNSRNQHRPWQNNLICPSHYMGIVEAYHRATGEPRYLDLAKKFFAMRDLVRDGGDDNQDRIPISQQDEAEGHAVLRSINLYAGAADLFLETGDSNLWGPHRKNLDQRRVTQKSVYHRRLRRAIRRRIAGRSKRPEAHHARAPGLRAQFSIAQHDRLQRNLCKHWQHPLELADVSGHWRRKIHGCSGTGPLPQRAHRRCAGRHEFFYTATRCG